MGDRDRELIGERVLEGVEGHIQWTGPEAKGAVT